MDGAQLGSGFQRERERDWVCWGESRGGGVRHFEGSDFFDADAVFWEQGGGQVEGAVAVGLVDCVCEGTEFARDVGCGDGTAYEEEVLSLLEWLGW